LLSGTEADWRLTDEYDTFTLPPLPDGLTEHLLFDPKVIPPDSSEFVWLNVLWSENVQIQLIKELNSDSSLSYGADRSKLWHVNLGSFNIMMGMYLLIRADYSAKTEILESIGRKLVVGSIEETIKTVRKVVCDRFPVYANFIPGIKFIKRVFANLKISKESEDLINQNLENCVLPGHGSRRLNCDEKGAKFTGNSPHLLAANKPEAKVVTWHADCAMDTRCNEPFIVHMKTHRHDPSGSQTILEEYFGNWIDLAKRIGHKATFICNDDRYTCDETVSTCLEEGVSFISALGENKFRNITSLIKNQAIKAGESVGIYNKEKNLLILKRTDKDGKTKTTLSNYFEHSRILRRQSDFAQWDAYNKTYYLDDHFHMQITTKDHRRWPFRHGSNRHSGIEAHIFDITWCFLIEDIRVGYRAALTTDIDRPKYSPFLANNAWYLIEKGCLQSIV
jgi:hypothetical protein